MPSDPGEEPEVRILHNLARCGGTVVGKCLGCMSGHYLLSEIHPAGVKVFNPLRQAHEWFGLLTAEDLRRVRPPGRVGFADAIELIARRCTQAGGRLILRDWAHVDYHAAPFLPRPTNRPSLVEALQDRFRIERTAVVRHPIDQWLSLRRLKVVQGRLTLDRFLSGYRVFVEQCVDAGATRYEDLARQPVPAMQRLCAQLDLEFDGGFVDRWADYARVTGEIAGGRVRGVREIRLPPRRAMEGGLPAQFEAHPDYAWILDALGYGHPGPLTRQSVVRAPLV